ncbi:MerR family transcriptional regulator [Prescottella subtropica]|uniref:MerR family transcriptional regulator n=1 Tax=Prescottella subtropica TaxID=2545757 RepID=UPI001F4FF669|nr:MerR family transcriptional regulator [Prescottella subtropica]
MRIGQVAEAAGTTTRAVRHYHRLGLLAEPERLPNGYREYTVDDVVRLMRIRWLADSGVPLGSVAAVLGGDASDAGSRDVVDDLRALLDAIRREQATLARRSALLAGMLSDAESGNPISALPTGIAAAFRDAIGTAETASAAAVLERERDLLEMLAITGNAPASLLDGFAAFLTDPGQRSEYLAILVEWSTLAGRPPASVGKEIDVLVHRMVDSFDRNHTHHPGIPAGIDSSDDSAHWALDLDDVVPDPAQREVVLRATRILLSRTEES